MTRRLVPMPTATTAPSVERWDTIASVQQPDNTIEDDPRRLVREGLPFLHSLANAPVINMHPGVYQIILLGTERTYVGSSLGPGGRLRRHAQDLVAECHSNLKLQRAWKEYGADRFRYRLLQQVDNEQQLAQAEQHWIDHFKAADIGFNILPTVGRRSFAPVSEVAEPVVIAPVWRPKLTALKVAIGWLISFALLAHLNVHTPDAFAPVIVGFTVWSLGYIYYRICRRCPLAGVFIFAFINGLLGARGGYRRRW